MLQEPLVQNNILATILRNFNFYLFGSDWLPYALGVLIFLSLTVLISNLSEPKKKIIYFPPAVAFLFIKIRTDCSSACSASAYMLLIFSL